VTVRRWDDLTPELDPIVVEAMKGFTLSINHNNTIAAGFEKDIVVSGLPSCHVKDASNRRFALCLAYRSSDPFRLSAGRGRVAGEGDRSALREERADTPQKYWLDLELRRLLRGQGSKGSADSSR
jgi:hypothetical protein